MRVADFSAKSFAAEERSLEFTSHDTAIVCIDAYNIGCSDGEPCDDRDVFWDLTYMGNGFEVVDRIREIIDTRIAPVISAARRRGIQIIYNMPGYVANRQNYLPFHVDLDSETLAPEATDWPPAEFRADLSAEITRWTWGKEAAGKWGEVHERVDFPPALKPVEGDIVIPQSHAVPSLVCEVWG